MPSSMAAQGVYLNQPKNTYCVQYMGVNDDRLEVLTRRVMFDNNYNYWNAKRMSELSKEYTIKYERRPQKLQPIYKEQVIQEVEPEPEISEEIEEGKFYKEI